MVSLYRRMRSLRGISRHLGWRCYAYWGAVLATVCVTPPVAAAEPTVFAAFGDYGGGFEGAGRVAAMIDTWNVDFIITTGDNNYGSVDVGSPDWERVIGTHYGEYMLGRTDNRYPLQRSPVQRFFPSVGNHDTDSGFVQGGSPEPDDGIPPPAGTGGPAGEKPGYIDYFHTDPGLPNGRLPAGVHNATHSYYDFQRGPVHLFAVDADRAQADVASGIAQKEWLERGLANSTAPWKFVYFHHSSYSSGPHGPHALMQWPFEDWGADAVLTGHDHNYERIMIGDFPYFVTGVGGNGNYGFPRMIDGSAFRYSEGLGSMRIIVDDTTATFHFLAVSANNPNGDLLEEFVLSKPIPEPSTLLLGMIAGAAMLLRRRARLV